ncbi:MAG: hypothetical protein ACOVS5_01620 [Oligoflexus sp.]|jgi:hypothetical protein
MARLLSFFICLFIVLSATFQAPLQATTAYALELQPVRIQFSSDDAVQISYLEPCGTEFAGLLYRGQKDGVLEVAVVTRRFHARCLSITGMQEMTIPFVRASRYSAVVSMQPSVEPLLLKHAATQSLHLVRRLERDTLHAVYTSQCGSPVGLFVQAQASGYRFGVLESSTLRPSTCNRTTQVFSISRLDATGLEQLTPLASQNEASEPLYELRRVPVHTFTVATRGDRRQLQAYYLRRCNEAPIGLVRQEQDVRLRLSMLVAVYPEMSCPQGSPKKIWTAWNEGLELDAHRVVERVQPAADEKVSLVRPTAYNLGQSLNQTRVEVKALSSCQRDLGLVTRTSSSGLAIGILQLQDAQPCNSPLNKVTYAYEWNTPPNARRDVKPLELVGS